MEKKTIGSFIAVLRKAAGLTQRELAERLNVSDKSVSRWERDECAPDLSLIPVIAEIFDITTDELLRGERKTPANEDAPHTEPESLWKKEKSTRQFQNLLRTQTMKLKERSLISLGVTFGGYLAALICNFTFLKALLGFFLALAFYAAAIILEICFLRRATVEEDDAFDYGKWLTYQNDLVKVGVKQCFLTWLFFGATLPLLFVGDAFYGMMLGGYLISALISTAVCFLLGYLVYILAVRPSLIKKSTLFLTEEAKEKEAKNRKLFLKTSSISALIAVVLVIFAAVALESAFLFAEKERFDDFESFKAYMETPSHDGLLVLTPPESLEGETDDDLFDYPLHTIEGSDGTVIYSFYWKNSTVSTIEASFDQDPETGLPLYAITADAYRNARYIAEGISAACIVLAALQFCAAMGLYFVKSKSYRT